MGTHYQGDEWSFGASYKSPQWFQSYKFNTSNELGVPRTEEFNLDVPATISVGVAYHGIEDVLFALDVRFIDFANTSGYDLSGYAADGSLQGLGFDNIIAVSLGTQLDLTDRLTFRAGYSYNDTPIPSSQATANAASPVIIQHQIGCGLSYRVTGDLILNAAYVHAFKNDVSGSITLPTGTIPGSTIKSTAQVSMICFGATVEFGP